MKRGEQSNVHLQKPAETNTATRKTTMTVHQHLLHERADLRSFLVSQWGLFININTLTIKIGQIVTFLLQV
jgi:hypothetical protein